MTLITVQVLHLFINVFPCDLEWSEHLCAWSGQSICVLVPQVALKVTGACKGFIAAAPGF